MPYFKEVRYENDKYKFQIKESELYFCENYFVIVDNMRRSVLWGGCQTVTLKEDTESHTFNYSHYQDKRVPVYLSPAQF